MTMTNCDQCGMSYRTFSVPSMKQVTCNRCRIKQKRDRRKLYMKFICNSVKEDGCQMCGRKDSLTFHHIDPETKTKEVNRIVLSHGSISELVVEIEKCAVVCEFCHRSLHDQNQGWKNIKLKPIRLRRYDLRLPDIAYRQTKDDL